MGNYSEFPKSSIEGIRNIEVSIYRNIDKSEFQLNKERINNSNKDQYVVDKAIWILLVEYVGGG